MTLESPQPADSPTIEQGVNTLIRDAKKYALHRYANYEARVRRSPTKSMLCATAAGYCLHRLPLRSLLISQVRLVTAVTPVLVLAFGAAKVCEYLQNQATKNLR